jgi:ABC-type antimicrobial peptide transport system permease subunit
MHKLYTTLGLVLGVSAVVASIIGVAAVVTMAKTGRQSNAAVQNTIDGMGASTLLIMPGTRASGGVTPGSGAVSTLTPQDADAMLRECSCVRVAAAVVRTRTEASFGDRTWIPLSIYGTTPSFLDVREWTNLEEGEPFTDADVRNQRRVCLVGQTIKRELFNNQSPVGQEIRLRNVSFQVIGVLSPRGANMMGLDQDDIILAPWTSIKARVSGTVLTNVNQSQAVAANPPTAPVNAATTVNSLESPYPAQDPLRAVDYPQQTRFTNIDQILVRATSTEDLPLANRQITELLQERHRIQPGQPDDFAIRDMTEMSAAFQSGSERLNRSLYSALIVCLIVGAAGIGMILLARFRSRLSVVRSP